MLGLYVAASGIGYLAAVLKNSSAVYFARDSIRLYAICPEHGTTTVGPNDNLQGFNKTSLRVLDSINFRFATNNWRRS